MELWKLKELENEITTVHHEDTVLFIGTSKSVVAKYQLLKQKMQRRPVEGEDMPYLLQRVNTITMTGLGLRVRNLLRGSPKVHKILSDPVRELIFVHYDNYLYVIDHNLTKMKYTVKESRGLSTFVLDEAQLQSQDESFHRQMLLMGVENKLYFVHYIQDNYHIEKKECLLLPEKINQFRWYKNTVLVGFPRGRKYCKINLADNQSASEEIIDCDEPYLVMMHHEILLRLKETIVILNLMRSGDDEDDDIGMMTRSTIHFTQEPLQIATMFPYIVGLVKDRQLSKTRIEIKNLYDRNDMSNKPFHKSGRLFTTSNTKTQGVFLTDKKFLYILSPIPYSIQIKELLKKCRCQEAFEMFKKTFEGKEEERKEEHIELCIKAGFSSLFHGEVDQAFKYFREAMMHFDIREILFLFDVDWRIGFPEKESDGFRRSYNKKLKRNMKWVMERQMKDVQKEKKTKKLKREDMVRRIEEKFFSARSEFLVFLNEKRNLRIKNAEQTVIENTIVKLLLQLNKESDLSKFIKEENGINIEMKGYLDKYQFGYFKILLLHSKRLFTDCLKEIKTIITNNNLLKPRKKKERGDGIIDRPESPSSKSNPYQDFNIFLQKRFITEAVTVLKQMDEKRWDSQTFQHLEWIFKEGVIRYIKNTKKISKSSKRTRKTTSSGDNHRNQKSDPYYGESEDEGEDDDDNNEREKDDDDDGEGRSRLGGHRKGGRGRGRKNQGVNMDYNSDYDYYLNNGLTVLQMKRKNALNPDKVLHFFRNQLDKFPSLYHKYLLKFLEYLISEHHDQTRIYHNELTKLYIELISKELEKFPGIPLNNPGTEPGKIGTLRQNLLMHLENSDFYDYNDILHRLQPTKLYHELCRVYKKLKQHEKALQILVLTLKQPSSAEKYCAGEFSQRSRTSEIKFIEYHKETKSDRFLALLKICFKQKEIMVNPLKKITLDLTKFAIKLLNTYPNFIDVEEAIQIIPGDIPVRKIRKFLEVGVQQQLLWKNYNKVHRNLWKTNYYDWKEKMIRLQERWFVHDLNLCCKYCGKKVTTSAICVYPNFCIVHYNCRYKLNQSIDPVKQRNFKTFPIQIPRRSKQRRR